MVKDGVALQILDSFILVTFTKAHLGMHSENYLVLVNKKWNDYIFALHFTKNIP